MVYCDNFSVVSSLNSGRIQDKLLVVCLRDIWFLATVHEFEIRACRLPSYKNRGADLLSRWHLNPSFQNEFFSTYGSLGLQPVSLSVDMNQPWTNQRKVRIKQSYEEAANQNREAIRMFVLFSCSISERKDGAIFIPKLWLKHSKQHWKSKFSVFSTRGRRSTTVRGWFHASKHQKTVWSTELHGWWRSESKFCGFKPNALCSSILCQTVSLAIVLLISRLTNTLCRTLLSCLP